ncbi:sulfite exporter TauE/SafE family protein [Ferruginibacter sp. SUN002]|uniref:sulfite exporter TauE/SafE family protein n=1 Tax=Ferruginibacter sp. SUN002 TaxID=2937789 RepID=UPI003D363590
MKKRATMDIQTILIVILIGILAGMLGGLVGVGGGLIIVPALVYFLGFSQHAAQGTSLGLILLPVGILGVLQYYKHGDVDFKVVGILAVGFLIGSYFGSKISLSLPQETVKKIFAVFMIIMAIKMLFLDKPKADKNAATTTEIKQ